MPVYLYVSMLVKAPWAGETERICLSVCVSTCPFVCVAGCLHGRKDHNWVQSDNYHTDTIADSKIDLL